MISLSTNGRQAWIVDADSNDLLSVDLATGATAPPISIPGHPHMSEIVYQQA